MHDIRLAIAKNYVENQREEVMKRMHFKASAGTYPGRAPFGYRNNKAERTIEIDPSKAAIAQQIFEKYATGRHSLLSLSKEMRHVHRTCISKTNLHKMLTNPFYIGQFRFSGETYNGTHKTFISPDLYVQVQSVLNGHNRPKYSKHEIAFRGMLTCAHDGCMVTGEIKKGRYVYYHCTGFRGPCALPRFREQEIADRLGHVLRDVQIPAEVVQSIAASLQQTQRQMKDKATQERSRLERELATVRGYMDRAYTEKLEGRIPEDFWQRKQAEWLSTELRLKGQIAGLEEGKAEERLLDVQRILELAQKAYFLYLTRKPAEQAELLKSVLSNCSIDAVSLYPTYRKPFDMICKRAKSEEWSGREDSNLRPPGPELTTDLLTC
jgi:hypothetical protein